ncbi:hypothetical protein ACFOOM_32375 [Streptomyces echinoruber]|uniref:Uncharacterized protein n=1 Tax=Streptomyces echinoruber TaxID=68898 RepID=A0A918RWI3_9ACTN|nr:hypothetical protein [Streptomyces echinoruber]GHA13514.1 hypothetical protein GCM10010389_60440 [Streptomyces echinoruber]
MNFVAWLQEQTGREDATGRVALAVTNHLAEGWTPRSGSVDEVRKLGLALADVDAADARYRAGHMENPFLPEELEMGAAR